VEEKDREAGARKGGTETGAENGADTEVVVRIELGTSIHEVEVEVKRGS